MFWGCTLAVLLALIAACGGDTATSERAAADGGVATERDASSAVPRCACNDLRPVCLESTGECVACSDGERGACRGPTPLCIDHHCRACASSADCAGSRLPVCKDGACVACRSDAECGQGRVCDPTRGACGECSWAHPELCGGERLCDVLELRCTDAGAGTAALCDNCVSDTHCAAGSACVEQRLGAAVIGTFCLPLQGSAGCARPYTQLLNQASTIEGKPVQVCALEQTSCVALRGRAGYGAGCGVDAAGAPSDTDAVRGEDTLCGMSGVADALCVYDERASAHRCTLPCGVAGGGSTALCPAQALDGGALPTCRALTHFPAGAQTEDGYACSL